MTTGELILVTLGLVIPIGGVFLARWSGNRLERDDPARRRGPAE
jgi:hypothetical protein